MSGDGFAFGCGRISSGQPTTMLRTGIGSLQKNRSKPSLSKLVPPLTYWKEPSKTQYVAPFLDKI
jgi:hypothetical protein